MTMTTTGDTIPTGAWIDQQPWSTTTRQAARAIAHRCVEQGRPLPVVAWWEHWAAER